MYKWFVSYGLLVDDDPDVHDHLDGPRKILVSSVLRYLFLLQIQNHQEILQTHDAADAGQKDPNLLLGHTFFFFQDP